MNIKTKMLTAMKAVKGYTIIEVMIFLAVSGGLLVAVLGLISGQQQKTRFVTGVNDFDSVIQDLVNDVETGYYPNSGNAGTDNQHIFLGKAVQFYKAPSNEVSLYKQMTIQGDAKTGSPPRDVTNLTEANPQGYDGLVSTGKTLNGVELTKIIYRGDSSTSFGFAIVSGISSSGNRSSGSKGQLAKIDVSQNENDLVLKNVISALDTTATPSPVEQASQGIVFCLREGGGGRVAAVTLIGGGTTTYFDQEAEGLGCSG